VVKSRIDRLLHVTSDERAQLEAMARSRSLPAALARRAKIVLLTEDGLSDRQAALRLQVSQPTVSTWRRRFRADRIAGLHDELRPGRPRSHDEDRLAELLNTVLSTKPAAGTHWSVRTLAEATELSKSAVQRYLHLFGVQPHRTKSFKLSNDPFFIEKLRDIVGLYLGDLVANALADDLALELREGQQNVQGQAPHRGCRVELLRCCRAGRSIVAPENPPSS
jgi:transposase